LALYAAIAVDVAGLFLLAAADGFASPLFAVLALVAFGIEVPLFSVALGRIEASIAFALYGMGTGVVAVISIVALDEPASPLKVVALAAIVAGVVTLTTANTPGATRRSPPTPPSWRLRLTGDAAPLGGPPVPEAPLSGQDPMRLCRAAGWRALVGIAPSSADQSASASSSNAAATRSHATRATMPNSS
jgi:multidrug transporter EmrE-like cation transporter